MPKGNNTDNKKRSHNYKPYDASNSSIVKRFTSKVTEILPGHSWISRWLSSAPQLDYRQDRDDEDEEEYEKPQPPVKRIRLETALNDYSHQNHVQRLNDLQEDAEGLSPISRVDHQDEAVAGPSGLQQLGRSNFVASTPAVAQNKATNCDDVSDSGESTSGCSSLVPQAERSTVNLTIPKINTTNSPTHKLLSSSTSGIRRLSTSRDKYSKVNLSSSIGGRPSFDTYAFHNPHNKSMNSSRSSQLDDSSPFYRGRTMYGGASASRETLMPLISHASRPRVTNVKPVSGEIPERDTIGTSALRIMRALQQMSTPVTEAKRMPVNEALKRRKPIQPFEELSIPQMPALLRIKRKRYEEAAASSSGVNVTIDTTDSETVKVAEVCSKSLSQNLEKVSTKQPITTYSLREEITNKSDKFTTSIKGRNAEIPQSPSVEKMNLPNVKLDITSLPTFSLPIKKPPSVAKVPSPVVNVRRSSSTESNTGESRSTPARATVQFKFSEPIVESTNGHSLSSVIKHTFKFSKPLDADCPNNGNELKIHNSLANTSFNQEPNRLDMTMKAFSPKPLKLKRKIIQDEKSNIVSVKPFVGQTGSIMDYFNKNKSAVNETEKSVSNKNSCVNVEENNKNKSTLSEENKLNAVESKSPNPSDSKWYCKKCLQQNNNSECNCVKCGTWKNKEPSKDKEDSNNETVKCKTCSSTYKASESNCRCCSEKKTETLSAPNNNVTSSSNLVPLSTLFKKKEGSWECDVCLVSNSSGDSCASCATPKPGAAPKEEPKPAFSFGIPPAATANTSIVSSFKFGFENASSNNKTNASSSSTIGGFKFGSSDTNVPAKTEFRFGSIPPVKETETLVSTFAPVQPSTKDDKDISKNDKKDVKNEEKGQEESKSSSVKLFSFGNISSNDKITESKEEATQQSVSKDIQPAKKVVTFSQQLVEEKTISCEETTPSTSFTFTPAVTSTKTETPSTATFAFTPKVVPLFNVPSSTSENNPPTSSIFKLGSTSTTPATVTTTSPDNTANVSSTVSSSSATENEKPLKANTAQPFGVLSNSSATENEKPTKASANLFSGLSNSSSKSVIPTTTDSTKFFANFGNTNKTSQFNTNVATTFMFGSGTSNDNNKSSTDKEEKKEGITTNSFFYTKKDNEQQPPPFLFNAKTKTDEKKYPFYDNMVFGGNREKEWNTKPALPATTSSTPALFGSATTSAIPNNNAETKSEPFTFNATSTQSPANSITPFVFKGANDAAENKTSSGGFSFSTQPSSNVQLQSSSTGFAPPPATQQNPPRMFCPVPPMFCSNSAPSSVQPTSGLFTFGANQQNSGGFFRFPGAQVVAPSGESSAMGDSTFSFDSQNVVPLESTAVTPAAAVPPTFDPNIKPNFNFSGSTTPTFSATSSTNSGIRPQKNDRKIRKAVRRTIR